MKKQRRFLTPGWTVSSHFFWKPVGALVLVIGVLFTLPTHAQNKEFPSRPIRLLVPFAAASSSTTVMRLVSARMTDGLGQPIVVENQTGAGGLLANSQVAKASPDGHTLLLMTGTFTNQAAILKKLPYDPLKDFQPISILTQYPFVLMVNSESSIRNAGELVATARSQSGKLNYGSSGIGSGQHLAGELFDAIAGTSMIHIPYRSSPIFELLGKQVDVTFDAVISSLSFLKSGKLRALAVTSSKPWFSLPGVAPLSSTLPGYDVTTFLGLAGPNGLPTEVVARLNKEVRRVLALSDVRERFLELGAQPEPSSPEEMASHIKTQIDKWVNLVNSRKIERQ